MIYQKKKRVQITLLDSNLIYNNLDEISFKLKSKGYALDDKRFISLYENRKNIIQNVEKLKNEQNSFTKKISKEKRKPDENELLEIGRAHV